MLRAMPSLSRTVALALAVTLSLTALPARAQSAPTLTRLSGRCGANTLTTAPAPLAVTATVRRGVVRLRLQNFVWNCAPAPQFHVVVSPQRADVPSTPVTLTAYLPPTARVADCACAHELTYALRGLPPGAYELRVESGDSQLPARAQGTAALSYVAVSVVVR
jgi:hypothetical protein